jgi:glycine dehydrogenase subunit 1
MRYIPHTDEDRQAMLATIGAASIDELFASVPEALRAARDTEFPRGLSEPELISHMEGLAAKSTPLGSRPSFLGAGCYRHYTPSIVGALSSRGEFLTAYTPYQAEASQGTLQAVYEFQSMVAELCDLPLSNASLYDGATALCEALLMIDATWKGKARGTMVLSKGVHPEYRDTVRTYFQNLPYEIVEVDLGEDGQTARAALEPLLADAAAFAFQSPTFPGTLEDAKALTALAQGKGARVVMVFQPIAVTLTTSPGEAGVDVAVGEGQCLGNDPNYGGPHLGLFCAQQSFLRRMPGRIVGKTVDADERPAYVLTLQTREQHIRREKATSNICTNVGLVALRAAIHLATLGKEGLREVARISLQRAHALARRITELEGFSLRYPGAPFFHEVAIRCPLPAGQINRRLQATGIEGGVALGRFDAREENTLLLCTTEQTKPSDLDALVAALWAIANEVAS